MPCAGDPGQVGGGEVGRGGAIAEVVGGVDGDVGFG